MSLGFAVIRSLRCAVIALRVICLRRPLGHYAALSFVVIGEGMEHRVKRDEDIQRAVKRYPGRRIIAAGCKLTAAS